MSITIFLFIVVGLANVAKTALTISNIREMFAGTCIDEPVLRSTLIDTVLCGIAWGSYGIALVCLIIQEW